MSLSAAVIDAMVAAGCTAEQLAAAMKADMAEAEARKEAKRENNAERQRRFREKRGSRKDNARNALRIVTPPIDITHTPSDISPDGENHRARAEPLPWSRPAWFDDEQAWQDFLTNRKRKKMPNTPTAYTGFLADIDRIADDEWPPPRLLKHASAKGWGGIYDPRTNQPGQQNDRPIQNRSTSTASAAARARANLGV